MDEFILASTNGQTFGIQLTEVEISEDPASPLDRLTTPTGIRERADRGVSDLAHLLAHIAEELGGAVAGIESSVRPSSVEAEVTLGLSAQAGPVWLISGKGEYSLRAKFVWNEDAAPPSP